MSHQSGTLSVPVRTFFPLVAAVAVVALAEVSVRAASADKDAAPADSAAQSEARLLSTIRQLTFEGRRAGEGYFSSDGSRMVFQSEREPGNPFFQIYWMDLENGDVQTRISPGHGKTTCAWIHPDGHHVLFASTHADAESRQKQADEIKLRQSGQQRRYSWDYDEHFDLYEYAVNSRQSKNLTNTRGYDAEGSYSPDGRLIAFASNRLAYTDQMREALREKFKLDAAVMMDIYIMNADGSNPRRLTEAVGYDGGPFFSPDGQRICWRRFAENGATAEIMTMNLDGSDKRQLTRMGAMSWAPFYHPSGEYLIFATNVHGFGNFELYLVDVEGSAEPVRVTHTEGFDGLPAFTPDGNRLAWTTNRTAAKQSQIFMANWNHEEARRLLRLTEEPDRFESGADPRAVAEASLQNSRADFLEADLLRHVDYLCRPELAGRMTGSKGEQLATSYVAAYFDQLGLEPAGDDGSWFQPFDFTAGVDIGKNNVLRAGQDIYEVSKDWQPLAFSKTGKVAPTPVVFAGYGIVAPEDEDREEYDSFVHLDVKDKWILVFRFMPEGISAERRQHLGRHSSLRYKAMVARDKGARGLVLVSGPNSQVRKQLVPLQFDGTLSGASVPIVSVTDEVAAKWLSRAGKDLKKLQEELDSGGMMMGFEIDGLQLSAEIDIRRVKQHGRNVLARLPAGDAPNEQAVLVGAHIDHLGSGTSASSLAREDEQGGVHWGADDNASGVAGMLEVAEYLSDRKRSGQLPMKRDVIFAAWSGEELGLIGSSHFAKQLQASTERHSIGRDASGPHTAGPHTADPHASDSHSTASHAADRKSTSSQASGTVYPGIAACLNMDMIGRFEKRLILQGVGSSSLWRGEIERRNAPIGLPITLQEDSYLPTDASTFFMRGVPILSAFTGSHSDYHTPRDTPDKLNYEAAANIAKFMGLVARSLATRDAAPDFVPQTAPEEGQRRAHLRAYLGTIPDYAESDLTGVMLSGVAKDGPAAKAGVQAGDVIVELAGKKIDNIYDYTYAIEALKIGQAVKIVVRRADKSVEMQLVPGSRQ